MPIIRPSRIAKIESSFSNVLRDLGVRSHQYIVKYGVEHKIRCGRYQQAIDQLLSISYFSVLITEWDTFVVPFRYWRFLGLNHALNHYPKLLLELGSPHEHTHIKATQIFEIAIFFQKTGIYQLAVPYMQWSIDSFDGSAEKKEETFLAKLSLGELLRKQKQYTQALETLTSLIPQLIEHFHPHHEYVHLGNYHLANVYHEMDEIEQAESLFVSVLEFQKKTHGELHKETLRTMNDLAMVYKEQERFQEAEALYRKTISHRQKLLGPMHPSTVDTLHNLAVLCKHTGRMEEAESLFRQIVQMDVFNLGEEHPDSLISLSTLASFYMDQERFDQAEILMQKYLDIQKRKLPLLHDDVLQSIGTLADLYQKKEDFGTAVVLYQEIMDSLAKREGEHHIETQKAMFDWSLCLVDAGQRKQGIAHLCRLLSLWEERFGTHHEETLKISNELAHIYIQEKEYNRAQAYFLRDLSFQKQKQNAENLCWCHYNLAYCFQEQHAFDKAEGHFQDSIYWGCKVYGENDPETASLYDDFAQLWTRQEIYTHASKWRGKAGHIYMDAFGFFDEEVQRIMGQYLYELVLSKDYETAYQFVISNQEQFLNLDAELLAGYEESICLLAMGLKETQNHEKGLEVHLFLLSIQILFREPSDPTIAVWKNNTAWFILLETKEDPIELFQETLDTWEDTSSWFYLWLQLGRELCHYKNEKPHQVDSIIDSLRVQLGEDHPRIEHAKQHWSRLQVRRNK